MNIFAIGMVKGDADIVGATLRHLVDNGVDRVLIALGPDSDDTRQVLQDVQDESPDIITIFEDPDPINRQVQQTNHLASVALDEGADFCIPWDADEYIVTVDGSSIKEALENLAPDIDKLSLRHWQHLDFDRRKIKPNYLGKVAFRPAPGLTLAIGNHFINLPGGNENILDIREIPYRSYDHWVAKFQARNANFPPEMLADPSQGFHHRRLADFNEDQLRDEWESMNSVEVVCDPIPSKFRV